MAGHLGKEVGFKNSGSAAARQALARRVRGLVAGAGVHAKTQTAASTNTTGPSSSAPRVERDCPARVAFGGVESTSAASACPQLQRPPVCAAHVSTWMESPIGHLLSARCRRLPLGLIGKCWGLSSHACTLHREDLWLYRPQKKQSSLWDASLAPRLRVLPKPLRHSLWRAFAEARNLGNTAAPGDELFSIHPSIKACFHSIQQACFLQDSATHVSYLYELRRTT